MRIKEHLLVWIAFALCASLLSDLPVCAEGLWWTPDRKALAGIKSFDLEQAIVCEFPGDADTKFYERTDELKQRIRLAFGAYGIELYSFDQKATAEENMRFGDGDADLYVRITDVVPLCVPDMYSYCVTIYVVDWVASEENPDIRFKAITWADCRVGLSSLSLLESKVHDTLDKRLDKLIKDYLQAQSERLRSDLPELSDEAHSNAQTKEQTGYNWLGVQLCGGSLLVLGVTLLQCKRGRLSKPQ